MNTIKKLFLVLVNNKLPQMYKKSYFRQKRGNQLKEIPARPMIRKFQSNKEWTNNICIPKPTEKEKSNNIRLYNSKTTT